MNAKTLILLLLALSSLASAQTINRTVGADGKVTYTDAPAGADGAKSGATAQRSGANVLPPPGRDADASRTDPACQSDVRRYCAGSPGKPAFDCLLDHQQEITDACYDALKRRVQSGGAAPGGDGGQGRAAGAMQACRQDVQQLCEGIQPGSGRLKECLLDRQKDLSDACYSALAKRMQRGGRPGEGGR